MVFNPGPALASESAFEVAAADPNPIANGTQTHRFTVTAADAKGNLVPGAMVSFTTALNGLDPVTHGPVETNADGLATLDWSTTVAGTYQVRAYVEEGSASVELPSSPLSAVFDAGPASWETTWLIRPDNSQRADGESTLPVGMRVQDDHGNYVAGQDVVFGLSGALRAEGCDGNRCLATTDSDGLAWVNVSTSQVSTQLVHGYLANELGEPAQVIRQVRDAAETTVLDRVNGEVYLTFVPPYAPLDPGASSLQVDRASRTAGTDPFVLTATLTGEDGDPFIQPVDVVFFTKAPGAAGWTQGARITNTTTAGGGLVPGTAIWNEFRPEIAGTYQVEARVNGTPLGEPVSAQVTAGQAAAANSWLIEPLGSAPADGSTPLRVGVRAQDAHGNPAAGGLIQFDVPAGVTAGAADGPTAVTVPVGEDSAAWLELTTTVACDAANPHLVTASIGGQAVSVVKDNPETAVLPRGGAAHLVYTPGAAVAAQSVMTVPTAGSLPQADNQDVHRFRVETKDQFGNLTPNTEVVFTPVWGGEAGTAQSVESDAAGVTVFELKVTRAGLWTVTAKIGESEVQGSGAEVAFVAGPVDVVGSGLLLGGSSGPIAADGLSPHTVWVTVVDQYGNRINNQPVEFELAGPSGAWFPAAAEGGTITASGGRATTVQSSTTGEIRLDIVDDQVETVTLTARVDGTALGQVTFEFEAYGPSAAYSSYLVTPTTTQAADGSGWFEAVVTVKDATSAHQLVQGAVVEFETPPAVLFSRPGPYTTGPDGTVSVGLSSHQAGHWDVAVRVGGGYVGTTTTLRFVAGDPVSGPGLSRLEAPALASKAGGTEQQTIQALVVDAKGNPGIGQEVVFTVPPGVQVVGGGLPGSGLLGGQVTRTVDETGVASLALVSQTVNDYPLTARVGALELTEGSPAMARFVNAPLAYGASTVSVPSEATSVDGSPQPVTVTLVDEAGNAYLPATEVVLSYRLVGQTSWVEATALTATGGSLTWDGFTSHQAGTYEIKAEAGGHQLGTTQTTTLTPGPVDSAATLSTFQVGGPAAANGRTLLPVWMTAVDQWGNPVSGAELSFELQYAGSAGPVFQTTNTKNATGTSGLDGRVTLYAISEVEGEYPVVARAGGSASTGPAPVAVFLQVAPDVAKSEFSVSRDPANASPEAAIADQRDSYRVNITVRDEDTRPAAGVGGQVEFTSPTGLTTTVPFTTAGGGSAGQASVPLTTVTAGLYSVSVLVGGEQLATVPGGSQRAVTVLFVAGPPVSGPELSRLTEPTLSASADGTDTQVVRARAVDANGNAVSGAQVTFAVPDNTAAAGAVDGRLTLTAGADGVVNATFTSRQAGQYAVTATANGVVISEGSPAIIRFEDRTAPAPATVRASAGEVLSGTVHESDLSDAALGKLTALVAMAVDSTEVGSCPVESDGTFTCALPGLDHGTVLQVRIRDDAGNRSEATAVTVDREAPALPTLRPSDGSSVSGAGSEPGNTITVANHERTTLCAVTVTSAGPWQCVLTPPALVGDVLTVTEADQAGNQTQLEWRVGLPTVRLNGSAVSAGETQSAEIENFQPGETLTVVMYSEPLELGSHVADASGRVSISWLVPNSTPAGQHTVEVSGAVSGSARS
ncbi:MAG: Ig-like domain-containing protein, partial [Bifidobacteriaceae bacterium]|nr:Ig-like domain-containing protein [Bifidobacteriaceae bacterium]